MLPNSSKEIFRQFDFPSFVMKTGENAVQFFQEDFSAIWLDFGHQSKGKLPKVF